jgi:hypothetical protein
MPSYILNLQRNICNVIKLSIILIMYTETAILDVKKIQIYKYGIYLNQLNGRGK